MVAPFYVLWEGFLNPFNIDKLSRTPTIHYVVLLLVPLGAIATGAAAIAMTKRNLLVLSVIVFVFWWACLTFLYSVATSGGG